MTHPEPNITINVDVTNPGQFFFACCGLPARGDRLRQHRAPHAAVLRETPVERNDLKAGRLSESGQVSVVPDVGRILRTIGDGAKYGIHVGGIDGKPNSRMCQKLVVNAPSLILCQSGLRQDLDIVRQPQETQLSEATKMAYAAALRIGKPRAGRTVMPVNGERQRHPKVDVRKKHPANPRNLHSPDRAIPGIISGPFRFPPRSGFRGFARSSGEEFPEFLREQSAARPALFRPAERGRGATPVAPPLPRKRSPAFPQEAKGRQERRLRSECGRLASYCHFTPCSSRPQGKRTC